MVVLKDGVTHSIFPVSDVKGAVEESSAGGVHNYAVDSFSEAVFLWGVRCGGCVGCAMFRVDVSTFPGEVLLCVFRV